MERVGDRAAGVQRERGAEVAVDGGEHDVAGQRAGAVEGGEALESLAVGGGGGAENERGGMEGS